MTTNVPGPREPLYALGRELVEIIPYVPIASRLRLGVSIFSYCGRLTFGVTGDYDSAGDVWILARGIEAGLAELVAAAGATVTGPVPGGPGPAAAKPLRTRSTGTAEAGR